MKRISQKAQQLFKQWGQCGGKTRAKRLSSHERSLIAAKAAHTRWQAAAHPSASHLSSIRLNDAKLSDPVYLEEVLSEGTWSDWKKIYATISNHPFGEQAASIEKVCSSVKIYGVTKLWLGILHSVRGGLI